MHLSVLLLVFVPFASGAVVPWSCPTTWSPELPCNCSGNSVVCWGNGTAYAARKVTTALGRVRGDSPWHLTLRRVDMPQLPTATGSATTLKFVDCNLGELRKPNPMEWPNLKTVDFESVRSMHSLWSFIEGARGLTYLSVKGSSMTPTIGEDFRQVPASLMSLTLRNTGTSTIEPGSMAHLKDLGMLDIANMPIKAFPRSALPEKLPRLVMFFLVDTLLEKLEPSFFDGMPNLEGVIMDGNKFTTLESSWFTPKMSQLKVITMNRNPLQCSCDLLWIKQESKMKQSALELFNCYNAVQNLENVLDLDEKDYC